MCHEYVSVLFSLPQFSFDPYQIKKISTKKLMTSYITDVATIFSTFNLL